jgi:hypothetical protein
LISAIQIDLSIDGVAIKRSWTIERISFVVPEGVDPTSLSIWYWDEELSIWVEMTSYFLPELLTGDFDRIDAFIHNAGVYILVQEQ